MLNSTIMITKQMHSPPMNTSVRPILKTFVITCKYRSLLMPKTRMPLLVSFHPNNVVKFTLKNVDENKIASFLATVKSWFDGLDVLKIEEEVSN